MIRQVLAKNLMGCFIKESVGIRILGKKGSELRASIQEKGEGQSPKDTPRGIVAGLESSFTSGEGVGGAEIGGGDVLCD